MHRVDDAHFTENLALGVDHPDLEIFFRNPDFTGQQEVEPGVLVALPDDRLAVLVLADLAQLQQLAETLGLEVA